MGEGFYARIRSGDPLAVLHFFVAERTRSLLGFYENLDQNDAKRALHETLGRMMHPLALASLIALSAVKGEDFGGLLSAYTDGLPLDGIEGPLTFVPNVGDEAAVAVFRADVEKAERRAVASTNDEAEAGTGGLQDAASTTGQGTNLEPQNNVLVPMPRFADHDELRAFLDLEQRYVEALHLLPLLLMRIPPARAADAE